MKIIACLGNPEKKYRNNRHNAGFLIGNVFANKYSIEINRKGFSSIYGTGKINNQDVLILFPQTYMNNSGEAVKAVLDFYKEKPDNLIVIHDDIELKFGDNRYKLAGGHKGQNGLRSIISLVKSADFHRIRIGVGRPENPNISVADHVLSNFTKEEQKEIDNNLSKTFALIETLIK